MGFKQLVMLSLNVTSRAVEISSAEPHGRSQFSSITTYKLASYPKYFCVTPQNHIPFLIHETPLYYITGSISLISASKLTNKSLFTIYQLLCAPTIPEKLAEKNPLRLCVLAMNSDTVGSNTISKDFSSNSHLLDVFPWANSYFL